MRCNVIRTSPIALLLLGLVLGAAPAAAQRSGEVVIDHTKIAWEKTPILVNLLDVLSGGMPAVQTADLLQDVLLNDLKLSGLFVPAFKDVAGDSLTYQYAIEGSVEGALRDAGQTGENAPTTVSLNLVTWPERQLLLNKRYRPVPGQVRTSGPPLRRPGDRDADRRAGHLPDPGGLLPGRRRPARPVRGGLRRREPACG